VHHTQGAEPLLLLVAQGGRELGPDGLDGYLETKSIAIAPGG
jgi:hypothetical protein